MAKEAQNKKFRFQKNQEIGSPDAETDKFLMDVFVENDALLSLVDMDNQKSIIIGRTGSGKSALLRFIETNNPKVSRIEPEAMSLRFLSNSTILNYFKEIDVNLNFFYKILWKHVFAIELLKLYFGEDNFKKQNWFDTIYQKLNGKKSNPNTDRAINYLKKWNKDFWLQTETRVKEIEKILNEKFVSEIGTDINVLKAKAKADSSEQKKILIEYKNKAEYIISDSLANEIHEITNILKCEIFVDYQKKHFIIIDDLDKEWITSELRYELIGSMIEVIKELQVLKGVKIIIALRDNLYQLVFSGTKHTGGQREKFKPLYIETEWSKEDLKILLERRLEIITKNNLSMKNAFDKLNNENKKTGFDYIVERTFLRPRDIISFINHAISNANNKAHFSLDIIKKAEISYSIDRLQAIEDEWGENYGDLKELFKFLEGKTNGFRLKSIKEDEFMNIYCSEEPEKQFAGDLLGLIIKWKKDDKFNLFIKEVIFLLFKF